VHWLDRLFVAGGRGCGAEMSIGTHYYRDTIRHSSTADSGDISRSVGCWVAYPDGVGLLRQTEIANNDVVVAGDHICAGVIPESDIVVASLIGVQSALT